MEDIRSNPEEESLESPEAREEMETLDEATHEAEAYVERTGGHEEAEVVEGLVKGMVKGSPETIDPIKSPGGSASETEGAGKVEDGDKSDLIDLPDTKKVDIAATPLPIPKDEIGTKPIDQPNLIKQDMEPPHGGGADGIALDNPEVKKVALDNPEVNEIALDNPEVNEVGSTQGEAITGSAPTEMPPEMDKSDSDETVGLKWYQPIPDEEGSAMVKGGADMEPDPDIRNLDTNEVVGMKFHPAGEASSSDSPGVDQVSKIDSFTREGEFSGPVIGDAVPDVEAPPIADISDEVSKDPAYLEASEHDISDADSSPPEGDEIEEGD